jgi:hypothetical protein
MDPNSFECIARAKTNPSKNAVTASFLGMIKVGSGFILTWNLYQVEWLYGTEFTLPH